jgi:hypothetical protein
MIDYGDPANLNAEIQVKPRRRLGLILFAGVVYTAVVFGPSALVLVKMTSGEN